MRIPLYLGGCVKRLRFRKSEYQETRVQVIRKSGNQADDRHLITWFSDNLKARRNRWTRYAIIIALMLMTRAVFAVSPSEKQQLDNFHVSTLKGLRGVSVSVKIIRDDPDTLSLLKDNQLAGIAEMTLQKAGIEILPPAPDVGLYVVLVNVTPTGRDGANIAMHVQSSLLQIVNLSRDPAIKTEAQTWPSLGQVRFGIASIAIAKSAIERAVKDQAAAFAADYKAANPKQNPPDSNK